jgi:hypothetical protein
MNDFRQCPTCGRVGQDWGSNETKNTAKNRNKTRQRKDESDRVAAYRKWRWNLGHGCYVNDIDQVEWRHRNGEIEAVAILELSRVDGNAKVPDSYLDAVLNRFKKRDGQSKFINWVSKKLGIKTYIVLFRWDMTEFWLYDITNDIGWIKSMDLEWYTRWIMSL